MTASQLSSTIQRSVICLLVAGIYWVYTTKTTPVVVPTPIPTPAPAPDSGPMPSLVPYSRAMSRDDKQAVSRAYDILASSIERDPEADPVFLRVEQIRQAQRACLLMIWVALGNQPDKYPGLGAELDKLVTAELGTTDVPVSPPLRKKVVDLFRSISATFK